jgi:SSS family transporter
MNTTIVAVATLYFAGMIGIGLWAAMRTKTSADYFVAGKGVGMVAIALATMSSAMSGFLFIGGPGIQFRFGFGTLLLTMPAVISFGLAWYLLAKRMRLLAHVRPMMTVPDAIHARYDSNLARGLAAVAILLGVVGYLGTQTLAMGVVLSRIFDLSLASGVWIGVAIVAVYSVAGGMIAGIYTDVVQGLLMVIAALITFALALSLGGGMGNMVTSIGAQHPDWVGPFGTLGAGIVIGWYLVFSLGILGQPQVAHKFYMIRDPMRLKWGAVVATVCALVASLVWLSVGTVMRHMADLGEVELTIADEAAPLFMLNYAPAILAGVFFAGVAAASMSTADSFLIIGASALVRDLPLAFGRPTSAETQLRLGRFVTLLLCLAAGFTAWLSGQLVAVLGIFGWGMFAAALAPALGLGLNWKRATREGAIASLLFGIVASLFLELNVQLGWWPDLLPGFVYRTAVAFIGSFIVFIVVSGLTPPKKLAKDVEAVMDA